MTEIILVTLPMVFVGTRSPESPAPGGAANANAGAIRALAVKATDAMIFLMDFVIVGFLPSPPFYLCGNRNDPEIILTPKKVSTNLIIAKDPKTTTMPIRPQ